MSTTEVTTNKKEESPEVAAKRTAWGSFGVTLSNVEVKLQGMVDEAMGVKFIPTKYEEVPQAEAAMKEIRTRQMSIEALRKKVTGQLDKVTARLIKHEKALDVPLTDIKSAVIGLKKIQQELDDKRMRKEAELKNIRSRAITAVAVKETSFTSQIEDVILAIYKLALIEQGLAPDKVEEFLQHNINGCTAKDFTADGKYDGTLVHCTAEEAAQIYREEFAKIDPNKYVLMYKDKLREKFSDYAVAYANKQQAIANAEKEAGDAKIEAKANELNKTSAAKLSAEAQPMELTPHVNTKPLKKAYEVDMMEHRENAFLILTAFMVNIDKCLPHVGVKKWFSFTPEQAAKALAKVKCGDNMFQPEGIVFKEVAKL